MHSNSLLIVIMRIFKILFFLLSTPLWGALLTDISVVLIQPDGSELHCFTSGDEYYAWLHDENGYPIIQSQEDGYYYYGQREGNLLKPSSFRADNVLYRNKNFEKWSGITSSAYTKRRQRYWSGIE